MSIRLRPTFAAAPAATSRPLAGMRVCSGSPLVAGICAGAGLDRLLVDMEHAGRRHWHTGSGQRPPGTPSTRFRASVARCGDRTTVGRHS